uniref:Uncharacterized protein n=1 Tax=Rhizophora mucronata TaxID=61149 RepID=A0A2P2NXK6_RHIMU
MLLKIKNLSIRCQKQANQIRLRLIVHLLIQKI